MACIPRVNQQSPPAKVSVIIPVRNEQENVEGVVRSLAGQEGVAEILMVNDHSEDRTGEILARLAEEIPNLTALEAPELPPGWTGKNHALAYGAEHAQGEIFLFTDADTRHFEGTVAACALRMEREGLAVYSLSPEQQMPTLWERASVPYIYSRVAERYKFDEVNDPQGPTAAANGQFLMISRRAYEAIGGHKGIRGEILEDVVLAKKAKLADHRLRFECGKGRVRTRMYPTVGEFWTGWVKNLYLLFGGTLGATLRTTVSTLALDLGLPAGFFIGWVLFLWDPTRSPALGAALVLLPIVTFRQCRYEAALKGLGFPGRLAFYRPVSAVVFILLLLNSAWAHRAGGRVRWKGRSYPAKNLRQP